MTKFIDQKTILLFVGLSLLFLNRLTLFGVEILTPLLVFALVWYSLFNKKKRIKCTNYYYSNSIASCVNCKDLYEKPFLEKI